MDFQGSRNMVPRPWLEPHSFFQPHCYCLTYCHDLHLPHWCCISSLSHCLCCPPISQPPHWCQILPFSPSQLPCSYPKSSTLHLQPLLQFIISFPLPLSYGEHQYSSAPSHRQQPSTTGCMFWQSWTHLATLLMFKTLVVSHQAVSTWAHSIIPLSLHLFTTTDYSHSIYLVIYICTIPYQHQSNTISIIPLCIYLWQPYDNGLFAFYLPHHLCTSVPFLSTLAS